MPKFGLIESSKEAEHRLFTHMLRYTLRGLEYTLACSLRHR